MDRDAVATEWITSMDSRAARMEKNELLQIEMNQGTFGIPFAFT